VKNRVAGIYAIFLLVYGICFAFVTPPFEVPDEESHFFRSFQLSEGQYHLVEKYGMLGEWIPCELIHLSRRTAYNRVDLALDRWHTSPRLTPEVLAVRAFMAYGSASIYPPVSYVPQIISMCMLRLTSPNVWQLLYVARLFTLLCSVLMIFYALQELSAWPTLQFALFLLAATPMNMSQTASLSADAITNALVFMLFGLGLNLRKQFSRCRFMAYLSCSAALSLSKVIYLYVPFFILPSLASMEISKQRRCAYMAAVLFCCILPGVLWLGYIRPYTPPFKAGILYPMTQIRHILNHPLDITGMFFVDFYERLPFMAASFIGRLGWLDLVLPNALIKIYLVCLCVVPMLRLSMTEKYELRISESVVGLFLLFLGFLVLHLLVYITCNPLGVMYVEGVQGRNLIPLFPLLILITPHVIDLEQRYWKHLRNALFILWMVGSVTALSIVKKHYWYPPHAHRSSLLVK